VLAITILTSSRRKLRAGNYLTYCVMLIARVPNLQILTLISYLLSSFFFITHVPCVFLPPSSSSGLWSSELCHRVVYIRVVDGY
jgi:hypothetical protein